MASRTIDYAIGEIPNYPIEGGTLNRFHHIHQMVRGNSLLSVIFSQTQARQIALHDYHY
jgi:hypothetical protein